jgi:hypothetical protein
MLSRDMIVGILLAKGNFYSKVEISESTNIGYSCTLQIIVASSSQELLSALSRSLTQRNFPHSLQSDRLVISKTNVEHILHIIPRGLDSLSKKLADFRRIYEIVQNKKHLTLQGLEQILIIKGNLNGFD